MINRLVIAITIIILLFITAFFIIEIYALPDEVEGKWAEKSSERVVMDILPDINENEYQIFITWRENNLAQKDVYRFKAVKKDKDILEYKDGIHIYRTYNKDGGFEDKLDYQDGTGSFKVKPHRIIWTDSKSPKTKTVFKKANPELTTDTTVKNSMFSILIPQELKDFYETEVSNDTIEIFEKSSKKANFGGFAFGIRAYKNPADYATLPGGKKIGELKDKNGVLYDMVLKHPTDVQYDYTKSSTPPESYKLLYNLGDIIIPQGINGSKYFKNQGTNGKNLYKGVLIRFIRDLKEKPDSTELEKKDLSYMYNIIADNLKEGETLFDKIGYTYYDVNGDGIDELLIGEITEGEWKGIVYDMYTMVDRKPQHVMSGGSRNRFFVCDDVFICNEYSSGALESGVRVYALVENSTELFPQVSFKYDEYLDKDNPWFLSYGDNLNGEKWENVSEETIKERKSVFEKYERFDFKPLSKF